MESIKVGRSSDSREGKSQDDAVVGAADPLRHG